jgi:hypothetical protein
MDRTSFRVAALVATALLATACSDARADSGGAASIPATATSVPESSPESAPDVGSQDTGGVAAASEEITTLSAPQDPPAVTGQIQPSPSTPEPPPPPSANTPGSAPIPPPPQDGPGNPTAQRLNETPPAASEPADDAATAVAAGTSGHDPSTEQAPEPAAPSPVSLATPIKPGVLAEATSPQAGSQPADSLEQLLTDVGRRLRNVQGQIDDLRQHLDRGAPPAKSRLIDLRASLVRIAPMLVALEASLDAAGRLSPHLKQLLHRVRSDLRGVHVTAVGLIAALRDSGARGAEVRLLLSELEMFGALSAALGSSPAVGLAPTTSPAGVGPGYAALHLPAAGSATQPSAGVLESGSTGPRTTGSHDGPGSRSRDGRGSEEPPPWSPVPGSATAGPGGAFFFAAVAALTMLLIALTLPALRARLDLPPGRRYTVAFLAPLERPG